MSWGLGRKRKKILWWRTLNIWMKNCMYLMLLTCLSIYSLTYSFISKYLQDASWVCTQSLGGRKSRNVNSFQFTWMGAITENISYCFDGVKQSFLLEGIIECCHRDKVEAPNLPLAFDEKTVVWRKLGSSEDFWTGKSRVSPIWGNVDEPHTL